MEIIKVQAVKARNKKYNNKVVSFSVEGSYTMNGRRIYTGSCSFNGVDYNGVYDTERQGHPTFCMTRADNPRSNPIWFDVAKTAE